MDDSPEKKKILIVDDDPGITRTLSFFLSKDYQLELVRRGDEVLKRALAFLPDLILSDIRLPGIDGFEVLAQLRANTTLKDTPVLVMSAMSHAEEGRVLDAGGTVYMSKPFSLTRMQETISKLV